MVFEQSNWRDTMKMNDDEFLNEYLEICKSIYERMEREGSWPWPDSQNSENLIESKKVEKDL